MPNLIPSAPKHYLGGAFLAAVLIVNQAALATPFYEITDLDILRGNNLNNSSYGRGINAFGQVAGLMVTGSTRHAFVSTSNGQMLDLGTLGGDASEAYDINDSGLVTGWAETANLEIHAFITNNTGQMVDLGTLGGGGSMGNGINAYAQVTGSSLTRKHDSHAFVTNKNGKMLDLGTLGGPNSVGNAINDSGQVVGSADTANGETHAFITNSKGKMMDLGTLGGDFSEGYGINNAGQVTGWAKTASGEMHAFIKDGNQRMTDLGTLGGDLSIGYDINAAGQVVGNSYDASGIPLAFISNSGKVRDINKLLIDTTGLQFNATDWVIQQAYAINDGGQITGLGYHNLNGHAPLVSPTTIDNEGIIGTSKADRLFGSIADDFIQGLAGNDKIYGGAGNDELHGGAGNDVLDGGAGNDLLDGGGAIDIMLGGEGNDTYLVGDPKDVVKETADNGIDEIQTSVNLSLPKHVENLVLRLGSSAKNGSGNSLDNTITGNAKANHLTGSAGADQLWGNAGNDTLNGGPGNDNLHGETGNDTLDGGSGNDKFWFAPGAGRDVIKNFGDRDDHQDLIDLSAFNISYDNLSIIAKGNNTVITINAINAGDFQITLQNIQANSMGVDNFIFNQ